VGGCRFIATQKRRDVWIKGLGRFSSLMSNRAQVARPMTEVPTIFSPLEVHLKCSDHFCWRGLNNADTVFVSGSIPVMKFDRRSLHRRQASARLIKLSEPPRDWGRRCSTVKRSALIASGEWQYSHRHWARSATSSRRAADTI
jgi:hypothetical protein